MKIETFNHIAIEKILRHTIYQREVLHARDIYLASENIAEANHFIQEEKLSIKVGLEPKALEAHFSKEGEVIKFHIDGDTYRISGNSVTVEHKI
jgi:hypothetical protein